jgi:hypothetical protein
MAGHIVVGYLSDNSETVDIDFECSSYCSIVGGVESTSESFSSHSGLPLWADDDSVKFY